MVIITTRDTHRLATYSEKELGIGNIALKSFPVDAFGGEGARKERRRREKQLACLAGSWGSLGQLFCPPHLLPWHNAHLGFSSSSVHNQSDGESTGNDMDFKEGAKEVAAAQGDHLLWGRGQGWALGVGVGWQGEDQT